MEQIRIKQIHVLSTFISISLLLKHYWQCQLKLLFIKDTIESKLNDFHGLSKWQLSTFNQMTWTFQTIIKMCCFSLD